MNTRCIRLSFLFVLATILTFKSASAQDYKNALGVRGTWNPGFTFKHFLKESNALEFIVTPRSHGVNVAILYEKHAYAFNTKEFRWYYGLGGHVGMYNGYYYRDWFYKEKYYPTGYNYSRNFVTLGVDGILGLEYKITEIPFTIGVDVKPSFDIFYSGFSFWDAGLSVRYYW